MPGVTLREGEDFDRFLKRFTRACEKAGVLADYKKHQYFEKPSERRIRREKAARRRMRQLSMPDKKKHQA